MPISRLAFLDILEFEGGQVYRGAVLMTQEKTVPLEFYLTDPLRPNPIQKVLYGAVFEEYLKFEVFGKPLLKCMFTRNGKLWAQLQCGIGFGFIETIGRDDRIEIILLFEIQAIFVSVNVSGFDAAQGQS